MKLPSILHTKKYQRQLIAFGGLNTTNNYKEGELADCSGISHADFPSISQSFKLQKDSFYESAQGAICANEECVASNGALYYGKTKVGELSDGEKQLVVMGKNIIVFPDKLCYNIETQKVDSLEASYTLKDTQITFASNSISVPSEKYTITSSVEEMDKEEREKLEVYSSAEIKDWKIELGECSALSVEDITPGTIFKDKCSDNQYRKVLSVEKSNGRFIVKHNLISVVNEHENMFLGFRVGDGIKIEGAGMEQNNKTLIVRAVRNCTIVFDDGALIETIEAGEITIKREIPDFTCACVHENRLWGCAGNTIYASKLGDPYNFNVYKMLSTDSYAIESNSSGDFNACISYGTYCIFFKENSIYKIYGSRPSNFQLVESLGGGMRKDQKNSIVNVGAEIFYCGSGGIFSFYGGMPRSISEKIDNIPMKNPSGGSDGKCYYIAADVQGERKLFAYDIEKGLWSVCGKSDAQSFAYYNGKLHICAHSGFYTLSEERDLENEWYITLHPFDEKYHKTKNYSRLWVICELEENAWIKVETKKDDENWTQAAVRYSKKKEYLNIPLTICKCHSLSLRISGKGKCKLNQIVREFSVGG